MRTLGFALSSPVINRLKKPLNSVLRRPNMDALLSSPEQPDVASIPPARRQGSLCLHNEQTATVTNRRQLRDHCQRDWTAKRLPGRGAAPSAGPRQSGALAPHSTTLARSAEYHAEAPQFWSAPRQRRFAPVAQGRRRRRSPLSATLTTRGAHIAQKNGDFCRADEAQSALC